MKQTTFVNTSSCLNLVKNTVNLGRKWHWIHAKLAKI